MSKKGTKKIVKQASGAARAPHDFDHVLTLIDAARTHTVSAVNVALIDLYWSIGEYIATKVADQEWGKGVTELADHIHRRQPNARGFSASNL